MAVLGLSSSQVCQQCCLQAVLTSSMTGQLLSTAICLASAVALYTALASPPSTRTLCMPYEGPRPAIPSPAEPLALGAHTQAWAASAEAMSLAQAPTSVLLSHWCGDGPACRQQCTGEVLSSSVA